MRSVSRGVIGFAAIVSVGASAFAGPDVASPFDVVGNVPGIGAEIKLDADRYEQLRAIDQATIRGFQLGDGSSIDLDVERFSVWTPDAEFVVVDEQGERTTQAPDLIQLKGTVVGAKGPSAVYLALSPFGSNGYIELGDRRHVVSSGPSDGSLPTIVYDLTALPDGQIIWREFVCAAMDLVEPGTREPFIHNGGNVERSPTTCRTVEIAVDSDWEYTNQLFGGDTVASQAYIGTLIGAIGEIYDRDLATELTVGFTRVFSSNNDPYVSNNLFDAFQELQVEWALNPALNTIERELVHLLSPRSYSGAAGVAYLDGLCLNTLGYAVSGYLNGFFPHPLIDNNSQNWDVVVVAHELGHNHGTGHTHDDFSPTIDDCGNGDCSLAPQGTIMSYCHTCPGGLTNIRLGFHPLVISRMDFYMRNDAICDDLIPIDAQITQQPQGTQACIGSPASMTVAHSGPGQFTLQWYRNGQAVPGATSTTLSFPAVIKADEGDYYCVVDSGCESITSDFATLDVCGTDCNNNGLDDILDIGVISTDCNNNLFPDECDIVAQPYAEGSGILFPLGFGTTLIHTFTDAPIADTDVTLGFVARGDLSDPNERVTVLLGGSVAGFVFETVGTDCPSVDDVDTLVVPAAVWNAARDGNGDVAVSLAANSAVDPNQCFSGSRILVDASYTAAPNSLDDNSNSVPDECDNPLACSPADVTTTGAGSGDPGFGVPDGFVTSADLNFFVNAFVASDLSIADVTTTGAGAGDPGFGVPDGSITAADLNFYVNLWVAGCP